MIDRYPNLLDFQAWLTQKIFYQKMSQPGKMAINAEPRIERNKSAGSAKDRKLSVNTVNVRRNADSRLYCLEAHKLQVQQVAFSCRTPVHCP